MMSFRAWEGALDQRTLKGSTVAWGFIITRPYFINGQQMSGDDLWRYKIDRLKMAPNLLVCATLKIIGQVQISVWC